MEPIKGSSENLKVYKVKIKVGKKKITIRLMNKGCGKRPKPYFRISNDNKGAYDITGRLSMGAKDTHFEINPDTLVEDMLKIIGKIK